MNYNWNWAVFLQTSPDGVHTYLATLILGTGWTLATALAAWCMALVFGSIVGVIRTTPHPWLVRLGNGYVELFRDIPLLVQMFLWYFVLPELLPADLGDWLKQLPNASFYTAVVALGFYTSARVAEQVRAGIQSVPYGQHEASVSLGLNRARELRLVQLPQALRVIIPPLTNQYLNLTKNSSLAVAVGYPDLVSIANTSLNQTGRAFECIALIMAVYLTLSLLTAALMNWYNRRAAIRER